MQEVLRLLSPRAARRRDEAVKRLLDDPAFLVSYLDIERLEVFETLKAREPFSDIGVISRTDLLWAQGLAYANALAVRLVLRHWKLYPIQVYYDARRLTDSHRSSTERALAALISQLASEEAGRLRGPSAKVVVQGVEGVSKALPGEPFTLQQNGTWLADAAARLPECFPRESFPPNTIFPEGTQIARDLAERSSGKRQ